MVDNVVNAILERGNRPLVVPSNPRFEAFGLVNNLAGLVEILGAISHLRFQVFHGFHNEIGFVVSQFQLVDVHVLMDFFEQRFCFIESDGFAFVHDSWVLDLALRAGVGVSMIMI